MQVLINLIKDNSSFLIKRILHYAKLHNYVKYTSTLEEAWISSVRGLSESIIIAILNNNENLELEVDHDYLHDPISAFGVVEAQLHRQRGTTLEMFLGLMKYYRQTYLDLIIESNLDTEKQRLYSLFINGFFDNNEIAFCSEWTSISKENLLDELQVTNLNLTNIKNKYLTIFESIPTPIILLNAENHCTNMNYAAQQLFQENLRSPGYIYYSKLETLPKVNELLPWLSKKLMDFCQGEALEVTIEKDFQSPIKGKRNLIVKFHRMLDVSNKFEGTVIIFTDLTERKQIEDQLRYISFHDILTGLYNRAFMEEELLRVSTGVLDFVGFISCDVDGLKLVNDNLGHNKGDSLLITVSEILKKCFAKNHVIARIGGDEFAILMPLSDEADVEKSCERIREKVKEHNFINPTSPVSLSIGWSHGKFSPNGDFHEIIKEADKQMYIDKQSNHSKYVQLFKEKFKEFGDTLFK